MFSKLSQHCSVGMDNGHLVFVVLNTSVILRTHKLMAYSSWRNTIYYTTGTLAPALSLNFLGRRKQRLIIHSGPQITETLIISLLLSRLNSVRLAVIVKVRAASVERSKGRG